MIASVAEVVEQLAPVVAGLDVEALAPSDAAELVELFVRVEQLAAAGRVLATRAVAGGVQWRREGYRSPAAWMAAIAGMPVGTAIATMEMAELLDQLPGVNAAFRAGRLSEAQAREIADAASEWPDTEQQLLDLADKAASLRELRDECQRIKAAGLDEEGRRRRAHEERRMRTWKDRTGAGRVSMSLSTDELARLLARVDARRDEIIREAKQGGWYENADAHRVDALIDLVCASEPAEPGRKRGPEAMVHVLVDYEALVRGHTLPGEKCEVPGVGTIAVSAARRFGDDCILKVLVRKGVDICAVAHAGRAHIPAHFVSALEVRDEVCIVPGCDMRRGLEIDHINDVDHGGDTEWANLARLCRWHHYQKTHLGYRYRGGPGDWEWLPPELPPEAPDDSS